ncbi:MAG: MurR/RpiR family transcriptional regulator [Sphingomonadales bacterium]|nr:MAG: MurR/RpiR family transcriptional regulator [Sphingomonadales bacterium]
MSRDLLQRLEQDLPGFTRADRTIANFILANRGDIAFESAHSLAAKLKVSPNTVGRFARKVGYLHFKDLKSGLRMTMTGVPWLVGDQLAKFVDGQSAFGRTQRSLELELAGLIDVYGLTESDSWQRIVKLLSTARQIHVAGFQTERGSAVTLANLLQYARDGVSVADATSGNFQDVLMGDPADRCLILIDIRRYSKQCHALAAEASKKGLAIVMITDKFCDWIHEFTADVIAVPTEVELFWSSQVSLACAINLLVNDVIGALGTDVEKRLEGLSELYEAQTGYITGASRKNSAL